MKVQVATNLKGELFIRSKNKTFTRGTKVFMTDEEFQDSFTQSLIAKGWLIPLEQVSKEVPPLVRLRSNKKNPMVFKVLGRAINPNEVFYVPMNQFIDPQIQQALEEGHISKEDAHVSAPAAEQKTEEPKAAAKTEVQEQPKKTVAVKPPAKKTEPAKKIANKEEGEMKNSYVYRPKNKEINEPPQRIAAEKPNAFIDAEKETPDVDFVDGGNLGDLDFVDVEQEQSRVKQFNERKSANNEEVE